MIVEDNRADVYLLKNAFRKAGLDFHLIVFEDGESAFRYIDREPAPGNEPRPDLAILDLNIPTRDGSEVLARIRASPELRHILVIVFSSSPKQVMRDRAAHADLYITKPCELDEFLRIGEQITACIERIEQARP